MKILVIVAHPDLEKSRGNRAFIDQLRKHETITVRDLYQSYPNWEIDIEQEHELLVQYDRIVFQFPFYWYSCPPLLKKWFDDVLTYGWAFGTEGNQLKGKEFIAAITAGGSENAYRSGGDDWFTISEYLRPIQATILRCKGTYLPAFITYNTDAGTDDYLVAQASQYIDHISSLQKDLIM
ncbi:NAD(P)H-dependent oxidoreductase [Alkalihalobacillus hemicellulosilyticus]|uniref:Oxidoreductase n=1 Tax=Halalkalibacter hemicellulosilyticusJCM 9152 TaxID=1236971 RepID=W4QIR4_9BACI|nr:NAD(P)H-dependent oxidoreductase [Halalkalibacter hemicellulosilyticus]GAE31966.1 oxidoreductase [Halalkalibacter hemicellulosilyticusJCM 9152]